VIKYNELYWEIYLLHSRKVIVWNREFVAHGTKVASYLWQ